MVAKVVLIAMLCSIGSDAMSDSTAGDCAESPETCASSRDDIVLLQNKVTVPQAEADSTAAMDSAKQGAKIQEEVVAMKPEDSDEESDDLRPEDKTSKDYGETVVEELQDIFDELDEDSSGELECEELYQKIAAGKPHSKPEQHDSSGENATVMHDAVCKLIASADQDGNGALSFAEFFLQQMGSSVEAISTAINGSLLGSGEFLEERIGHSDLMSERTEVDDEFSDDANIQQIDEENIDMDMSGRKHKNKKQKKWAAKQILKNQETICERATYGVGWGRYRDWAALGWDMHCNGWDQVGLICYKPCRDQFGSGWHGVAERCYPGCRSGYINGRIGECHERCGDAQSLPQVGIECHGWIHCADSWGTCNRKAFDIAVSFASFASNLFPYARVAMKAAKTAKAAGKTFGRMVYAAIKAVGKKMLKKAKKNLIKYMRKRVKEEGKQIKEETMDAIFEGGAELVATGIIKNQDASFGEEALKVAEAIDPIGVAEIVAAFKARSCNNLKIDPMPTDGLVDESPAWSACTWHAKKEWRAAHWDCTPNRHYSVGTSTYEECQTVCLEDWGSKCGSIEWRQGVECRTFKCKVRDYYYNRQKWYVGHSLSCPNYACNWNNRGHNKAAKWHCTPIRHYNPGSYADCQQLCYNDHGEKCGAVEWRHGSECRTFGCTVTDYYYPGHWHIGHASNCPM